MGELVTEECSKCKGAGYTTTVNFISAKRVKKKCLHCGGRGFVNAKPVDTGVVFFTKQCVVGYWQELKEGKPIATLSIHINQIKNAGGVPLFKFEKNSDDKLAQRVRKPRLFVEIVDMNTKVSWRRRGVMSKLLDKALADPKIEWAESSWDDSTADGRNFLLGKGFKQLDGKLLWVRGEDD